MEKHWKDITFIYNISFYMFNYYNLTYAKRVSTPLFQMILENFDKYVNETQLYRGPKWFIYSAHDTNLALINLVLNISSIECMVKERMGWENFTQCPSDIPSYASTIIFELYRDRTTGKKYIKIRYNGNLV